TRTRHEATRGGRDLLPRRDRHGYGRHGAGCSARSRSRIPPPASCAPRGRRSQLPGDRRERERGLRPGNVGASLGGGPGNDARRGRGLRTLLRLTASAEAEGGARLRQWSAMSPELRQVALTAVSEGSGQLVLREIEDRDLGVLFEHSSDRDAIRMAAFTSPEFDDRTSFERRWARLRSDSSTTNRVIEIDGRVVGHIASFDLEGRREVTYWIGREDWGRGIATRALQEFLQLEATRPL